MRKSLTTNNFKDGLIMDINPMQMPNTAYINGLNVTLITKDGNEHILQNDMGNGRVETAYLPEGYIPLGTCSLGGIIYVASYNPLKDKGLIGCFPSPERNISSDEESELVVLLTNNDFQFKSSSEGAETYYLKKQLWADRQFNPGDKFIVYGSPISDNFEKLWIEREYKDLLDYWTPKEETEPGPEDEPDESEPDPTRADEQLSWDELMWELLKSHTVNLSIGTITNTGKLIVFSNLKEYNTNNTSPKMSDGETTYPYLIFEYSNPENPQKTDLDDYRSLVSQPYNVFNSKISGQLVLIAELVQFNDFDMTIKNNMGEDEDGHKTYEPIFNFNYEGDYPYIPYGAECEFLMTWKDDPTVEDKKEDGDYSGESEEEHADYLCHDHDSDLKSDFCEYKGLKYDGYKLDDPFPVKYVLDGSGNQTENDKSIHYLLNKWAASGFFDNKERNSGGKIRYKIKPSMIWGPVSYLEVNGLIDLDKIGTGYIGITQWRYYNDDNTCTLNWGLEVYEEDGYEVKLIVMRMTRITGYDENSKEYSFETIDYFVDTYDSYFGTFTENIPLNSDYFKIKKVVETTGDTTTGKHPVRQIESQTYDGGMYQLKSNQLYFVDIRIWYQEVDNNKIDDLEPTRHAYRWLYTNGIFNSYYGRSQDFGKEQITFDLSFTPSYSKFGLDSPSFTQSKYGEYFKLLTEDNTSEPASTHSVIQNEYTTTNSVDIKIGLKLDYDTFDLDVSGTSDDTAFTITTETGNVSVSSSIESLYTGNDDSTRETYMPSTEDGTYETKEKDYNEYKNLDSEELFSIPHTAYIISSTKEDNTATNNTLAVTINGNLLQTVRGYTTPTLTQVTFNGIFRPLAYNEETFLNYGLEWAKIPYNSSLPNLYFYTSGVRDELLQARYTSPILNTGDYFSYFNSGGNNWQFKKVGLFGQIEYSGEDGVSYGDVCSRNSEFSGTFKDPVRNVKKKFEGPIKLKSKDAIGFHFQSLEECADAWLSLGLTKPIEFFIFYFGGKYDHEGASDDGTDCYCWPDDDQPRVTNLYHGHHIDAYPDNTHLRSYMMFMTMRDVSGSYFQIPLNAMTVYNCAAISADGGSVVINENGDTSDIRFYPGYFSYYGFPHIIAQWLNNIYIYTTDEQTAQAYIPLNVYWEKILVSYISIPIKINTKYDALNLKKIYLKLDDGKTVDLHDMYKIMAEKYGVKTKVDGNEIYLIDIENKEENEVLEKKLKNGEWIDEETDILHPNIDYIFNNVDNYELSIDFNKSDLNSGAELYDTFSGAQSTVLTGAVMDLDGTTLLSFDLTTKRNTRSLYMRDLKGNISLANNFIPYQISYDQDTGAVNGYRYTYTSSQDDEAYLLDNKTTTGINLNNYFVIDNEKIYLNDDHAMSAGDFQMPVWREDDSAPKVHNGGGYKPETYCDGIIDVPILKGLKIPNT